MEVWNKREKRGVVSSQQINNTNPNKTNTNSTLYQKASTHVTTKQYTNNTHQPLTPIQQITTHHNPTNNTTTHIYTTPTHTTQQTNKQIITYLNSFFNLGNFLKCFISTSSNSFTTSLASSLHFGILTSSNSLRWLLIELFCCFSVVILFWRDWVLVRSVDR